MFLWCHSDVNCRLDMCRRQYANDACNRGTAGNFEWIRCASTAGWTSHTHIILKSLSTSLSLSLCSSVLCVLQYFCQQPKKNIKFHSFLHALTRILFTHSLHVRFRKNGFTNYCFLSHTPYAWIAIRLSASKKLFSMIYYCFPFNPALCLFSALVILTCKCAAAQKVFCK